MSFEWLAEPVSEDAPTGPDLEATDDGKFIDYYFEAESMMPERYFTPGIRDSSDEFMPGTLFDKKSINLKADTATITDLLKRSRDLRLLSLLARLSILAGDLPKFADTLTGIALVLETFPDDVHPKDLSDRRGALDDLGGSVVVSIPLQYVELAGAGEVSLRRMHVALGKSEPREGELDLDAGKLSQALSAPGNGKAVEAAHTALNTAAGALARIKTAGLVAEKPFTPAVDATVDTIREIQELIAEARPDLQPWSAEPAAADTDNTSDEADDDAPATASAPQTITTTVVATDIPNRIAAERTLQGVESYFATHEPSSPALLLVTQARKLVGMPLVDAIDLLLPADAERTTIGFGAASGFKIDMTQLRALAQESSAMADTPAGAEDVDTGIPVVETRAEASGHIASLETFYRVREPASPIPMLLSKARTFMEKDFAKIVAELVPPQTDPNAE